jgi:hypothetical protein
MTSALEGCGWSAPRSGLFSPGKDPVPIVQEAEWAPGLVWTCAKNHKPTGIFLLHFTHYLLSVSTNTFNAVNKRGIFQCFSAINEVFILCTSNVHTFSYITIIINTFPHRLWLPFRLYTLLWCCFHHCI